MLALVTLAAVAQAGDDPAAHGASLLAPFKAELKSALMAGMKKGPATAIEVCSQDAPGIAASLSVDGVLMGRSSHKLRNPDNAAPEWLAPIIEAYASGQGELVPVVVELEDGRHGYAEPVRVQPLCLTCHGTTVHADVADSIGTLYPNDEATGFSEGDFRGVFWVTF
jgi:hypothetical protein